VVIKVCGITREEDAMLATDLGAAAVGFVFWRGSPRAVTPECAQRIVARLPPFVCPVGVFVNETAEAVERIAAFVGLGAVQLHGDETLAACRRVTRRVVKAVPATAESLASLGEWPADVAILVDTADRDRRGGTGRLANWAVAAAMAARRRVILAGGLSPANVAEAVGVVRPFALDVSSGTEASPGIKDHARLRAFFAAANGGAPR
jgi:phosphoribosylanthranilate isomerase